mgnify:CR=1 FL=1
MCYVQLGNADVPCTQPLAALQAHRQAALRHGHGRLKRGCSARPGLSGSCSPHLLVGWQPSRELQHSNIFDISNNPTTPPSAACSLHDPLQHLDFPTDTSQQAVYCAPASEPRTSRCPHRPKVACPYPHPSTHVCSLLRIAGEAPVSFARGTQGCHVRARLERSLLGRLLRV